MTSSDSGKVVLITGCSSGLGKRLAERLAHEGHRVYAGIRQEKDLVSLGALWRPLANHLHAIKLDVAADNECLRAVHDIADREGRLDALINAAAVSEVGRTERTESMDLLHLLNVNVVGALRCIRSVLPLMEKGSSGIIINITSVSGLVTLPYAGPYAASKHALQALTTALRYEIRGRRIWVTAVAPGLVSAAHPVPRTSTLAPARERSRILRVLLPPLTDETVVQTIAALITATRCPPATVVLGRDAKLLALAYRFFPRRLWDMLWQKIWDTLWEPQVRDLETSSSRPHVR